MTSREKKHKIITNVAEAVDASCIPLAHTIPICPHSLLQQVLATVCLKAFSGLWNMLGSYLKQAINTMKIMPWKQPAINDRWELVGKYFNFLPQGGISLRHIFLTISQRSPAIFKHCIYFLSLSLSLPHFPTSGITSQMNHLLSDSCLRIYFQLQLCH